MKLECNVVSEWGKFRLEGCKGMEEIKTVRW